MVILILFKEYSHLQLKAVKFSTEVEGIEKYKVDMAIEYLRMYAIHKLTQSKLILILLSNREC